jgi:hypothetical protein
MISKKQKNIIFHFIGIMCLLIIGYCILLYLSTQLVTEKFETDDFKICYITAIYGSYETSCKSFTPQTINSDFICFTDNPNITSNGWTIDTTPYHILNKSTLDDNTYVNSIENNKHTFNIAKYYKQQFQQIPILTKYDVIIWLDGTIEITNPNTSVIIKKRIFDYKIIGWMHENRNGKLKKEIEGSDFERYTSTFWNNQEQPYQNIYKQYHHYIDDGYNDDFCNNALTKNEFNEKNLGVWITCFVAFLNKDKSVTDFLNLWYLQTLTYTTQDQIGFSYVCYKTGLIPYTFPDDEISGDSPHGSTSLYIKHNHGK